jgi:hypothetical protein
LSILTVEIKRKRAVIINNTVYIRYGASGDFEDTWYNDDVGVRIKIY